MPCISLHPSPSHHADRGEGRRVGSTHSPSQYPQYRGYSEKPGPGPLEIKGVGVDNDGRNSQPAVLAVTVNVAISPTYVEWEHRTDQLTWFSSQYTVKAD